MANLNRGIGHAQSCHCRLREKALVWWQVNAMKDDEKVQGIPAEALLSTCYSALASGAQSQTDAGRMRHITIRQGTYPRALSASSVEDAENTPSAGSCPEAMRSACFRKGWCKGSKLIGNTLSASSAASRTRQLMTKDISASGKFCTACTPQQLRRAGETWHRSGCCQDWLQWLRKHAWVTLSAILALG